MTQLNKPTLLALTILVGGCFSSPEQPTTTPPSVSISDTATTITTTFMTLELDGLEEVSGRCSGPLIYQAPAADECEGAVSYEFTRSCQGVFLRFVLPELAVGASSVSSNPVFSWSDEPGAPMVDTTNNWTGQLTVSSLSDDEIVFDLSNGQQCLLADGSCSPATGTLTLSGPVPTSVSLEQWVPSTSWSTVDGDALCVYRSR